MLGKQALIYNRSIKTLTLFVKQLAYGRTLIKQHILLHISDVFLIPYISHMLKNITREKIK